MSVSKQIEKIQRNSSNQDIGDIITHKGRRHLRESTKKETNGRRMGKSGEDAFVKNRREYGSGYRF